jgi:hypothetical protein
MRDNQTKNGMRSWRLLAAALVVSACGDLPLERPRGEAAGVAEGAFSRSSASTLIGYGVANGWQHVDPGWFAQVLAQNGLTLTVVEAVPWDAWVSGGDPAREIEDHRCACDGTCEQVSHPGQLERFVEEMRNWGITTLVSLVNWNACVARRSDDEWFRDRLDEVLRLGPDGVILAPVTEPWSAPSTPRRWTEMAHAEWPGLLALPSLGGSSPEPLWNMSHDFVDLHHCRDDQMVESLGREDPRLLNSSDCTPTGDPGPDRAASWTREAVEKGGHLVVFNYRHAARPNLATIEAMGREIP